MVSKEKNNEEVSILLKWTLRGFFIVTALTLIMTITFSIYMNLQQKEYSQKYEKLLDKQEKLIETVQQAQSNKSIQTISYEKKDEETYQGFLANYYTTQSNWLNAWLTILAIVLGVMGIIIPIIIADKKKEMDDTVEKGKIVLSDIQVKAQQTCEKIEKDVDVKLARFDIDFNDVKNYVAKAKESENKALASTFFNKAYQYSKENKFNEAIGNINKALELDQNFAQAYSNKGFIYSTQGKYSLAIENLNKAIELNSNDSTDYYNLTEAYIFNKQFDKALDTLKLFLQKEPLPFILTDDYDKWINALNDLPDDTNVQQIKEIMETKLTKKERE